VKKLGLSLVWFVGGGGFPEPLECPFLATVWDIQHRTHPFLPEMQTNGEWFYREAKISGFLPRAAAVVTGTREGARQLEAAYGILPEHILIAPHPVPSFFLRAQISPNTPVTPPFFLYPANFWPHKNHATLIRAFARLAVDHPMLTLVLAGGEPFSRQEAQLCTDLGIRNRVTQRTVAESDMPAVYAHARLFVFPSRYEGFGLPALEAMACGTPTLLCRASALPEVGGDAARYFEPGDDAVLAALIDEVVSGDGLGQAMRRDGLRRAAAFTWERTAHGGAQAYQQALAR